MFALISIGALLFKSGKLSHEGARCLSEILISVILPFVIIKSYIIDFTLELLTGLLISFAAALVLLLASMLISHVFFKKIPIANFSAAFSNAGFIGIPLVSAFFGNEAVFYISSFVALLNIFQGTYGVYMITGNRKNISICAIISNPIIIGFVTGLCLFVFQADIPEICIEFCSSIAALNAPVAMFSLGVYISGIHLKHIFTDKLSLKVSLFRLIIIPFIALILLSFLPEKLYILKFSLFLAVAAPVGSNAAVFAQIHHINCTPAVKNICLSTLLSLLTLPLLGSFASFLWAS